MGTRGWWVIGPLLAIVVTACSSGGPAPTSAPFGSPAVTPAPATASVAATVAPVSPEASATLSPAASEATGAPAASSSAKPQSPSAAPSSTSVASARPSVAPAPRPTTTPRPATPPPSTPAPAPADKAVQIAAFSFTPQTASVPVGSRITWTNRETEVQHTVTADDGSFASEPLAAGSSFSHVFATVGTFTYHCSIHPDMTGRVVVNG